MKEVSLFDKYKHIPDNFEDSIDMLEANQSINIYTGNFILKYKEFELIISGQIEYGWLPSKGAKFHGSLGSCNKDKIRVLNEADYFEVIVEGINIGNGFTTSENYNSEIRVKGAFRFETITGDKSIAVEKVKFSLPNFEDFLGQSVKKITGKSILTSRSRMTFDNEKYIIVIDKSLHFKTREKSVKEKGGYILTHIGEITPKKGSLTFLKAREVIDCLNIFLSFVNGKRTSALFIQGMVSEKNIWTDYSNFYASSYGFLPSWSVKNSVSYLNGIWCQFYNIWTNKDNEDVLRTAIHWYLECNKHSGFVEGSIIMAQTALELLYNWFIVENKKMLIGKDTENISASNKIRLLIHQLNIDYEVPKKFDSLESYRKSEKLIDAPDAVVQLRNAIVHSQEEKRKKLKDISSNAKAEALNLCIWYIELTLLRILEYDGLYLNRCSQKLNESTSAEFVPWKKNSN